MLTSNLPLREISLNQPDEDRLFRQGFDPRRFFHTEDFGAWVRTGLLTVRSTRMFGKDVPAHRQFVAVVREFLLCQRLDIPQRLRCLRPQSEGVWELKTGDVRVFGWFQRRDEFVAVLGGDAQTIKDERQYDEKVRQVIGIRSALAASFIAGGDERAVITL